MPSLLLHFPLVPFPQVPFEEAIQQLTTLSGIGPKVAACVALFSLDKHQAVPVDTHVWTLATRYYAPRLAGKTLNPKLHGEVQRVFEERFGPYAGWAHNTLFISELASHKVLLPQQLQSSGGRGGGKGRKRAAGGSSPDSAAGDGSDPSDSGAIGDDIGVFVTAGVSGGIKEEALEVEGKGGAAAEGGQGAQRLAVSVKVEPATGRKKRAAAAGVAVAVKAAKEHGEALGEEVGKKRVRKRLREVKREEDGK